MDRFFGGFSKNDAIIEKMCWNLACWRRYKRFLNKQASFLEEEKYEKAKKEVIGILGEKETYSPFDAARFFVRKYGCIQIPICYERYYRCSVTIGLGRFATFGYSRESRFAFSKYDYETYCFFEGPGYEEETKVIALLVDYYNNESLSERYPNVKAARENVPLSLIGVEASPSYIHHFDCEKERKRREKELFRPSAQDYSKPIRNRKDLPPLQNDIIVIGSKDGEIIESMVNLRGSWLIEDIEYEIWYFRNHCGDLEVWENKKRK